MRLLLILGLLLELVASAAGQTVPDPKAAVAVAVAASAKNPPKKAGCDCQASGKCDCGPACSCPSCPAKAAADGSDALAEVNAKRAARGLRPYVRDEALTQAARACAKHRAANLMFGHTANDFAFLPAGAHADSAGCAAYPPSYGWLSCCVDDNYAYGGAAWAMGTDGKRYMSLFVSNRPNSLASVPEAKAPKAEPPKTPAEPSDPSAAAVRVARSGAAGSGTCVACEGGKSLVISNNHVFANQPGPGMPFPRAPYPIPCSVTTRAGQTLRATAVDGCERADVALVVVDGELPVVPLADADPAVGTRVRHWGCTSRFAQGVVRGFWGKDVCSDCSSISGDSGAGVVNESGELVGVHHGHTQPGNALHTKVSEVWLVVQRKPLTLFPRLMARAEARKLAAPKNEAPKSPAPKNLVPAVPGQPCPGGKCPNGTCPGGTCPPASPYRQFAPPPGGSCANGSCAPPQRRGFGIFRR